MAPTTSAELADALRGATDFFQDRQTRPGVLARRVLGAPSPGDDELVSHLERERRRRTRMDGGVETSLVQTAWTALELLQLEFTPDHAGVVRMIGYVLSKQNLPGRFGDECTDERHARGICQHFTAGFFSPGPWEVPVAPLRFPSGVTVTDEAGARFAASCFALRSVLRARQERRQSVRDHVLALLELRQMWNAWGGEWAPDLVFFALGGLAAAPLEFREHAWRIADWVAGQQRQDGSWPGADTIHALDTMLQLPSEDARASVSRAAPLVASLAADGTVFRDPASEEASLVALRVLKSVG